MQCLNFTFLHQSRFRKGSEQAVAWPERVIDIDWHWLVVTGSCRSLLCSVTGKLGRLLRRRPQGIVYIRAHTNNTHNTHTKSTTRTRAEGFYCIFRVMILERRAARRCVNSCVLLVVSVSRCQGVFIGVGTFCTRIKWITPIHFIVSLLSLLTPPCFHFTLFCCDLKTWGLKRDKCRDLMDLQIQILTA